MLCSMEGSFGTNGNTCMEDVMDGFLDTVDLNQLDSVELGELTNSLLENPVECVENISDSDSGISGELVVLQTICVVVGGDKNILTSDVNFIDDTNCFHEHGHFMSSTQSDCVLTDAVEPPVLVCGGILSTSKESTKEIRQQNIPASLPNPIRIIRIASGRIGTRKQPQGANIQQLPLRKSFPVTPINTVMEPISLSNSNSSVTDLLKVFPSKAKAVADDSQLHGLMDSVPSDLNLLKLTSISNRSEPGLGSISDPSDTVTFLDEYDPVTYADTSLEKHLNTSGSSLNRFQPGSLPVRIPEYPRLSPSSPSYLSPSDNFGSRDCLLTRAHLDRIRKKQERMIKNRHAASMSRLRKKEYLERLEIRYEQLKRENHQLWRQNEEWRVRCLHLEQALNDIQSKISDCTDGADTHGLVTPANGSRLTSVNESPSSLRDIKFEPPSRDPVTSNSSTVRSVSITYPSPTTVFSTVSRSNSRTGLCALYAKSTVMSNEGSSKWTLNSAKPFSDSPPQVAEQASQSRKTVMNSAVYPGKSTPVGSVHSARTKLISLGGIISRHRPSNFQSASRSKLIATTSLLTMFCLFSLNILTLPFSSTNSGPGSHVQAMKNWDHLRSHPFGQRVLLSVRQNKDTEQWQAQSTRVNCKFSTAGGGCLDIPSDSSEFNDTEPVHLLLGWIEEHEAFRVGTSSLSREEERHRNSEALRRSLPLTAIRDSKENRSRHVSFTKPRNRHVVRKSQPTPSAQFGASPSSQLSRSLSENVLSTFDPVPSTKESNFAAVNERAVQVELLSTYLLRFLQPFHPRTWDSGELIDAAGRQNGTVYVILMQLDHVQLQAVNPTYGNTTRKITFIVPAHPLQVAANRRHNPIGLDPRPSMLQVDCELINVSLIAPLEVAKTSPSGN
ncbi:Cyclic AMP dependent transcription factor ATF 6 [Fasciola gigantica]|uniref:Cyclic AMP dependent transcription factor ATF 6 n=1 Tax=Fasciola gigantica TaxID=46835 RepID=A0A504YE38_FASGI|nr:Cyclic AMP dependent transcription factor ATF 6 [Fasciola gigantica]